MESFRRDALCFSVEIHEEIKMLSNFYFSTHINLAQASPRNFILVCFRRELFLGAEILLELLSEYEIYINIWI